MGGELANFEKVMKMAFEDLYLDTKKTRKRIAGQRQKKLMEPSKLSSHTAASRE
jgi:hypothetical protein